MQGVRDSRHGPADLPADRSGPAARLWPWRPGRAAVCPAAADSAPPPDAALRLERPSGAPAARARPCGTVDCRSGAPAARTASGTRRRPPSADTGMTYDVTKTDAEWRAQLTPRGVRRAPPGGHRAPVHRRVQRHQDGRHLLLPGVRQRAVPERDEVRLALRLAELLRAEGRDAVELREDRSLGMLRVEVLCASAAPTSVTSSRTPRRRPPATATA